MTAPLRVGLLSSPEELDSAREVWEEFPRPEFLPELFLRDASGKFLNGPETASKASWSLKEPPYEGDFLAAVKERRHDLVLPLASRNDGTLQGMLEFLDIPYAGCGMTAAILAHDPDFLRSLLHSLDLADAGGTQRFDVGLIGNEDILTGGVQTSTSPSREAEIQDFARRVYRGLGLSGWALVTCVLSEGGQIRLFKIQTQPSLALGSPFRLSLEARGLGLSSALRKILEWGLSRHKADITLKRRFKDQI